MADDGNPIEGLSFEAALAELEGIVRNLEQGSAPLDQSIELCTLQISFPRGALWWGPHMVVAATIAEVETGAQVFELDLSCSDCCSLALPQARVFAAVVLLNVVTDALIEYGAESLPGIGLACDIAVVSAAIREVELPEILNPFRCRRVEAFPYLLCNNTS